MRPSIFQQSSKSLLSSPQGASTTLNMSLSDRSERTQRIKKVESEKCISIAALDKGQQTSKKSLFSDEKTHQSAAQKQELIEWLCGNSSKAFEDVMKTSSQPLQASSSSSIRLHSEPAEAFSESIDYEEPVTSSRRIRNKKPLINLTVDSSNEEINSIQNARTNLSLSLIAQSDSTTVQEKKKPSKIKLIPPENPKVEIVKQPYFDGNTNIQKEQLSMSSSRTNWLLTPMNFEKSMNQRQVSPSNSSTSENIKKIQVRIIEDSKDTKVNLSMNQTVNASPKFSVQNVYDEFIKHSSLVQNNPSSSSSSSASKLLNASKFNSECYSNSTNSSPARLLKRRTPLDEVAKAEVSQGKGVHSWRPSLATVLINQNNKQYINEEITNNLDDDDGLSDFEPRPKARTLDCYPSNSSASLYPANKESLYKSILKNPQAAFEAIFSDSQEGLHSRSRSPKKVTFAN